MRTTLSILLSIVLLGCSKNEQSSPSMPTKEEAAEWRRLNCLEFYWTEERAYMLSSYLGEMFEHLSEPIYWDSDRIPIDIEAYRFVWLRTFDPPIVVNLIVSQKGKAQIQCKVFNGQSGFKIGELQAHTERNITYEEASPLLAELREHLWSAPEWNGEPGIDGATWFVDGIKDGRYHFVHRNSPDSGWVRAIGIAFLGLAGQEQAPVKTY